MYLNELKRISVGEYLDDLELNKKVAELFGFDAEIMNGFVDKVGLERLGSNNFFTSLNTSIVIIALTMIMRVLLTLLVVKIS